MELDREGLIAGLNLAASRLKPGVVPIGEGYTLDPRDVIRQASALLKPPMVEGDDGPSILMPHGLWSRLRRWCKDPMPKMPGLLIKISPASSGSEEIIFTMRAAHGSREHQAVRVLATSFVRSDLGQPGKIRKLLDAMHRELVARARKGGMHSEETQGPLT